MEWIVFLMLYGLTGWGLGWDVAVLVTVGIWVGWKIVEDWGHWKRRRDAIEGRS
jgi:hypothetical protein